MSNQDKYTELSCNCTATERAFLDEIREKFEAGKYIPDEDYLIPKLLVGIGYSSIICQSDFKTNLKGLVDE